MPEKCTEEICNFKSSDGWCMNPDGFHHDGENFGCCNQHIWNQKPLGNK